MLPKAPDAITMPVTTKRTSDRTWPVSPCLGQTPNQTYLGRVIVDVWDEDAQYTCEQLSGSANIVLTAVTALLENPSRFLQASPLPDAPVLGVVKGKSFQGHVLIEVWDSDCKIAVSRTGPASDVVMAALRVLGRELSV